MYFIQPEMTLGFDPVANIWYLTLGYMVNKVDVLMHPDFSSSIYSNCIWDESYKGLSQWLKMVVRVEAPKY